MLLIISSISIIDAEYLSDQLEEEFIVGLGVQSLSYDDVLKVELKFQRGKPHIFVTNLKWRDISISFNCYAKVIKAVIIIGSSLTHLQYTIPARKTVEFEPHPGIGFGIVDYFVQVLYDLDGEIEIHQNSLLLYNYYIKLL